MDPKLKKAWLEALRSGKYVQGKERLKQDHLDGTKHCCLGVLCEVGGVEQRKLGNGQWGFFLPEEKKKHVSTCALPEGFLRRAGLDHRVENELIHMNDVGNRFFSEIATWIEQNL